MKRFNKFTALLSSIATLLLVFAPELVFAGKRVALVVGNSDYAQIASLRNPRNDAEDMGKRLQQLGFTLHQNKVHLNLGQEELLYTVNRFSEAAADTEIALLYFAGHGMQFNGDPHLLPVDIPDTDLNIVKRRAVDLNSLLDQLSGQATLTVAVFDACREIPDYSRRIQRKTRGGSDAAWRGLSRPVVQTNSTLIAFSGGSGELVADGSGRNSPYTEMLLEYLADDKLQRTGNDVTDIFQEISWAFPQRYGGQRPEVIVQGVRPNHFYLSGALQPTPQPAPQPAPQPVPEPVATTGRLTVKAEPSDARVRIMNIVPKYRDGIELDLNKSYDVLVSKSGYDTWRGDVRLMQSDQVVAVVLEERRSVPTTSWTEQRQESDADTRQTERQPYEPEMVLVKGGSYQMGSPSSEEGRDEDERQHRVTVGDMRVAKKETTVGQFRTFVQSSGYRTEAERNVGADGCSVYDGSSWEYRAGKSWRDPGFSQSDSEPVVCVSWNDANAYVEWLIEQTGKDYRLPTEAEWEYAARGGSRGSRHWGENRDLACRYANGADQAAKRKYNNWAGVFNCNDGAVHTSSVGRYNANEYGLHDMLGNVWEWTCSEYDEGYGGGERRCKSGESGRRSLRGGSWINLPRRLRSANRLRNLTGFRGLDVGFRVFQDAN